MVTLTYMIIGLSMYLLVIAVDMLVEGDSWVESFHGLMQGRSTMAFFLVYGGIACLISDMRYARKKHAESVTGEADSVGEGGNGHGGTTG